MLPPGGWVETPLPQVDGWRHPSHPHNTRSTFCWMIWFITFRAVSRWLSPWRPGWAILGLTSTQNTWKSCSKQGGGRGEREQHTTLYAACTLPALFSAPCTYRTAGQVSNPHTTTSSVSKSGRSTHSNTRTTKHTSATDTALSTGHPPVGTGQYTQHDISVSVKRLQVHHEQLNNSRWMWHAPLQRQPCLH